MVKQYPYTLQVLSKTEDIQDYEGNWIPGIESWVNHSKCRDISGAGKQVKGVDGNTVVVSFIVHCPKGTPGISPNKQVRVVDGTEIRVTGKVLFSDKAQLHTKIIC